MIPVAKNNRIGLGTVQFGLDYGISNDTGQVPETQVLSIIEECAKTGVNLIDTAPAYGNCEAVIGRAISKLPYDFDLVTKIPMDSTDAANDLKSSLAALGIPSVYGCILHSFETYQKDPSLWRQLTQLKSDGFIEKIGFSLYSPAELLALWTDGINPGLVQLPYNLFDRRFERYFDELKSRGTEIHIRSVFLQGLFFLNPDNLPNYLSSAREKLLLLRRSAEELESSIAGFALNFVLSEPRIDKAILGVHNKADLTENLNSVTLSSEARSPALYADLQVEDQQIILPTNWK